MVVNNSRLGVDLAGLDLRTTYQGDLALSEGRDNVRAAIMRRLDTPLGGLFSHPKYGNSVHDIISEVMDDSWQGKAISGIRQCLAQEPRITLESVGVEIVMEQRTAVFSILYSVLDAPAAENIVWEVSLL